MLFICHSPYFFKGYHLSPSQFVYLLVLIVFFPHPMETSVGRNGFHHYSFKADKTWQRLCEETLHIEISVAADSTLAERVFWILNIPTTLLSRSGAESGEAWHVPQLSPAHLPAVHLLDPVRQTPDTPRWNLLSTLRRPLLLCPRSACAPCLIRGVMPSLPKLWGFISGCEIQIR